MPSWKVTAFRFLTLASVLWRIFLAWRKSQCLIYASVSKHHKFSVQQSRSRLMFSSHSVVIIFKFGLSDGLFAQLRREPRDVVQEVTYTRTSTWTGRRDSLFAPSLGRWQLHFTIWLHFSRGFIALQDLYGFLPAVVPSLFCRNVFLLESCKGRPSSLSYLAANSWTAVTASVQILYTNA